jgi:hypothetical protein
VSVIPAQERVKKPPNRLKCRLQRRTREGGAPYNSLFQLDKWIPAFAGMTLRSLLGARNSNFFARSQAGIHASEGHRFPHGPINVVTACAGTTPQQGCQSLERFQLRDLR